MPDGALLRRRRDDDDFAEVLQFLAQGTEAWGINAVVVGEKNSQARLQGSNEIEFWVFDADILKVAWEFLNDSLVLRINLEVRTIKGTNHQLSWAIGEVIHILF